MHPYLCLLDPFRTGGYESGSWCWIVKYHSNCCPWFKVVFILVARWGNVVCSFWMLYRDDRVSSPRSYSPATAGNPYIEPVNLTVSQSSHSLAIPSTVPIRFHVRQHNPRSKCFIESIWAERIWLQRQRGQVWILFREGEGYGCVYSYVNFIVSSIF